MVVRIALCLITQNSVDRDNSVPFRAAVDSFIRFKLILALLTLI